MVGRRLLLFAVAVAVFHHVPSVAGDTAGDWIDLLSPFAVVGAAAGVLVAERARGVALAVAVVAAILYVDGHGIHLAANSIGHEDPTGDVERVTHFWDEEWGHFEWHLGLFGLLASFGLAAGPDPVSRGVAAAVVVLLGATFFTSTVEGGTWWLELVATAVFVPWALRLRRPVLTTCAGAFALAAVLIGVWAVWHGGVPEFSDVGWL
jgi:hypothetical protein